MGLLSMDRTEHDYMVSTITEAMALQGQEAKLYQVEKEVSDFYGDPETTYKKSVDVSILFEENPKPVLKKFGWYSNNQEELPYIVYMTSQDKDFEEITIQQNLVLVIEPRFGLPSRKAFRVSNVRLSSLELAVYICKLVPLMKKIDVKDENITVETSRKQPDGLTRTYLKM